MVNEVIINHFQSLDTKLEKTFTIVQLIIPEVACILCRMKSTWSRPIFRCGILFRWMLFSHKSGLASKKSSNTCWVGITQLSVIFHHPNSYGSIFLHSVTKFLTLSKSPHCDSAVYDTLCDTRNMDPHLKLLVWRPYLVWLS